MAERREERPKPWVSGIAQSRTSPVPLPTSPPLQLVPTTSHLALPTSPSPSASVLPPPLGVSPSLQLPQSPPPVSAIASASDADVSALIRLANERPSDVSKPLDNGLLPLYAAAAVGSREAVEALLAAGAKVDQAWRGIWTPCFVACANGRKAALEALLLAGADKNFLSKDGQTPLAIAIKNGHKQIVETLLVAHVDTEKANASGITPLITAIRCHNTELAEVLIQAGASRETASNDGWTPLHWAARENQAQIAEVILRSPADVNRLDSELKTPLMLTAAFGCTPVAAVLIRAGADPNLLDKAQVSPLIQASEKGHVEIVNLLLKAGATKDQQNMTGWTALMYAAAKGFHEVVEALLQSGATVDKTNRYLQTALILAAGRGHDRCVQMLLIAGADKERDDASGWTPLMLAAANNKPEALDVLVKAGADINRSMLKDGATPLITSILAGHRESFAALLSANASIEKASKNGTTPLIAAVEKGDLYFLGALLRAGADIEKVKFNGKSPLAAACEGTSVEVVDILLRAGAAVNRHSLPTPLMLACEHGNSAIVDLLLRSGAELERSDEFGNTPLMIACQAGHENVVSLLRAAETDKANKQGNTALLLAIKHGHPSIAAMLLHAGCSPEKAGKDGVTPLIRASEGGHRELVELLLSMGVPADKPDSNGWTALLAASCSGRKDVVEVLLRANADKNAATVEGRTPLIFASSGNHVEIVEVLLRAGASTEIADKDGRTPLIHASAKGHRELVELLQRSGASLAHEDNYGQSALTAAAAAGRIDVVEVLLHSGARPGANVVTIKDNAIAMLLIMHGGRIPDGWTKRAVFEKLAELMVRRNDRFAFELVSLGCPLAILKAAILSAGQTPHPDVFLSIDCSSFDVDTRDDVGESVLHWAATHCDVGVVNTLCRVGFDPNGRKFFNGRTPLFGAASRETAQKLIECGASFEAVDMNGQHAVDVLGPSFFLGQPAAQQLPSVKPKIITIAISGSDRLRAFPQFTLAEVLILGATATNETPRPSTGWSAGNLLRPQRFAWSSRRVEFEEGIPRNPGELPIVWATSERDSQQQLCLRIGDIEWLKSRKENVDIVVFAFPVDQPQLLTRLSTRMIQETKAAEGFNGSTTLLLGVGSEARGDSRIAEELSRNRLRMETPENTRAIARRCRINGNFETTSDPREFQAALLKCVGVHLAISRHRRIQEAEQVASFALSPTDPAISAIPLDDDEELREVKVLILGNQASGKTTLLRRFVEEDQRKQSRLQRIASKFGDMAQPKSTVGVKFKELKNVVRGTKLRVLDFAGQMEYSTIHENFLSPFTALYLIVVNTAKEDFREQVRHWCHMLTVHAKGPRSGSGLLIVCTMTDMVPGGEETVRAREREVAKEVSTWGISKQISVRIAMASNKTGLGLYQAFKSLREMARVIGSAKVPHEFKRAQADIDQRSSRVAFATLEDIKGMMKNQEAKREIERYDAWDDFLQHLHNVGYAVHEPASSTLCLDIEALSQVMSSFVASDHHIDRLFDASAGRRYSRSDIVSTEDAIARMLCTKGIRRAFSRMTPEERRRQCEMAIEFMKTCKLCFELSAEEAEANHGLRGLIFPCLRDGCDMIAVPFNRVTPDPKDRVIAMRLRSSKRDVGPSKFARALVELRPLLDPRFRVFSNCAVLRDRVRETQLLIALRLAMATQQQQKQKQQDAGTSAGAPSATEATAIPENEIVVAVQGHSPETWRESLAELLAMVDIVEPLCPQCAMQDSFNPLFSISSSIGARRPAAATAPGSRPAQRCKAGHQVQPDELDKGAAVTCRVRRCRLWAPLHGESLFRVEPEKWRTSGSASISTLYENERDEARRAEYLAARAAFWRFVGADSEKNIKLTKVEFIQNDVLEERFHEFYTKLVQRMMGRTDQAAISAADGPEEKAWRSWIMRQLSKSTMRVSGNEKINLIMGFHGSSEESILKIASTGFLLPYELKAAGIKRTDKGWYGRGIYLTQYASYGAAYAKVKASTCMLLSWVLMGDVYPVIERPGILKDCVQPYDSHYAVVDATFGTVCPPMDTSSKRDEIIVFSKAQVLPRYIFHFEEIKQPRPEDPLPGDLKTARPIVIWVDQNLEAITQTTGVLKGVIPTIGVIKCSSSNEAAFWLNKIGHLVESRLCVVTNRFREGDGGDSAWIQAIDAVRGAGFPNLQIIVYCRTPEGIRDSALSRKNVLITADPLELAKLLRKVVSSLL